MENRNELAVGSVLSRIAGTAEPLAALHLAKEMPPGPRTLGAGKGCDIWDLVLALRELGFTPHVVQDAYVTERTRRRSVTDRHTTRQQDYALSQRKCKRIEKVFGWLKSMGGCCQIRFRRLAQVGMAFTLPIAAHNLSRIPKLVAQDA